LSLTSSTTCVAALRTRQIVRPPTSAIFTSPERAAPIKPFEDLPGDFFFGFGAGLPARVAAFAALFLDALFPLDAFFPVGFFAADFRVVDFFLADAFPAVDFFVAVDFFAADFFLAAMDASVTGG
jgi:hypothetical protein